jgi:hypothetical protein
METFKSAADWRRLDERAFARYEELLRRSARERPHERPTRVFPHSFENCVRPTISTNSRRCHSVVPTAKATISLCSLPSRTRESRQLTLCALHMVRPGLQRVATSA